MLVELDLGSDTLQPTLSAFDGVTAHIDHVVETEDGRLRAAVWIEGWDEETRLDDALTADPTVAESTRLAETDGWLLYRVLYPEDSPDVESYRAAVQAEGATLAGHTSGDGWHLEMRFPDRDAACQFRDRCESVGLSVELTAVYDGQYVPPSPANDLSDPQRTALATALDVGYFTVPRDGTLGDVADRLDVSTQAASERIRRGLATLVADSVDADAAVK